MGPKWHVAAILVIGLSAAISGHERAKPAPKQVVAVYWYGKDYPANVEFDRGLKAAFELAARRTIEYHAEYLESNRFRGPEQLAALRDYLQRKYRDTGVDVMIALSQVSLDFLLANRATLFPNAPIVYHTFARPRFTDPAAASNTTGVVVDNVFAKTVDAALRFHPDTTRVFTIVQTSKRNREYEATVRDQLREVERRVKVTYLTDLPLETLLAEVRQLREHAIIFYVRYSHDEPGRSVDAIDVLSMIAATAKVPVYALAGSWLGRGSIGGYAVDVEAIGRQVGAIALDIVGGARAQDIRVAEVVTTPRFDWRQLQRWGIGEDRLPPGSVVLFRAPSSWQRYGRYAIGALAIMAGQLMLIVGLLVQRSHRRRAEKALDRSEARSTAILRALPDLMFILSRDGTFLDCHARDPDDLYVPVEAFLGRNVTEVLPPEVASKMLAAIGRVCESDEPVVLEYALPIRGGERHYETRLVCYEGDCVLSVVRDITERYRSEAALLESDRVLRASHERIADLAGRLIASQEVERQRLARDLHDDLSQQLALLNIEIDTLGRAAPLRRAGLLGRIREISQRTGDIASSVHRLSHDLHPSKLHALGLVAAIQAECRDVAAQHGMVIEFVHENVPETIAPDLALCLYRITQEALHNVVKHSGATRARVRLAAEHGALTLSIADQGKGFHPADESGLGLVSMRERANFMGGRFIVHSAPGRGTRLGVEIPVDWKGSNPAGPDDDAADGEQPAAPR
jgi:signal transduction histidine kinase